MKPRTIQTPEDYENALRHVETLMDADPGSLQERELSLWAALIERYEQDRFPIEGHPTSNSAARPTHRSILTIIKEKNWEGLPEHIRWSERNSRTPTVSGCFEDSDCRGEE